jgi:hypothetical protein
MTDVLEVELPPALLDDQPVPDVEADKPAYECPQCGRAAKSPAGLASHVRNCKGGEVPTAPAPLTPKQKKPNLPARGRQDASSLLGFVYSTAANFMPSVPAQRAMAWQAPTAGRVLDDAVAGTFIDKAVIQKIASSSNRIEPLFNLVALPMIAMAIDKQPGFGPMLYPIARRVMEGNLRSVLVSMKKEQDEAESLGALAASVGLQWETTVIDVEGKEVKVDVVDSMLSKLFEQATEAEPVAA